MTENEQKQRLSIAYVHAVAARAGFACILSNVDDDSIDMQLAARGLVGETAVVRSPKIDLQLKATAQPVLKDDHLVFSLPIKNYDDLRLESCVPRLLVVLRLPNNESLWLEQSEDEMTSRHCAYWYNLLGQPATANQSSVTVHLPRKQRFTVEELRTLMEKVSRRESL